MGDKPKGPDDEVEEIEIEQEEAAALPSREAMSLIEPSFGPKFPLEPSIPLDPSTPPPVAGDTTDQGIDERNP